MSSSQQHNRRNDSPRDRTSFQNNSSNGRSYSGSGRGGNSNAGNSNSNPLNSNSWNGPANKSYTNNSNAGIVEDHTPVNGFNAREVKDYLNNAYTAALAAARDSKPLPASSSSGGPEEKPTIYKVADDGWTTPNKSRPAWGPKQHLMANDQDFLSKLKKGLTSRSGNSPSTSTSTSTNATTAATTTTTAPPTGKGDAKS